MFSETHHILCEVDSKNDNFKLTSEPCRFSYFVLHYTAIGKWQESNSTILREKCCQGQRERKVCVLNPHILLLL